MKVGIVVPTTEIGTGPQDIRDFAQTVEGLGYSGIMVYDHVLGADSKGHPGWDGLYDLSDMFHEPFVLMGYLAAVTKRVQIVSGILVLPQRQTVLVAKQAAQVDVLSSGRLTLGVGIGWNQVEFEALGEDFENRALRYEEQVEVLRALWTQESVDMKAHWHTITRAGLNPAPIQRPIPIWFGGADAEPVLRRIGRIGDGWLADFLEIGLDSRAKAAIEAIRDYAREAGRDPSSITIAGMATLADHKIDSVASLVKEWQKLGASHFYLDTMNGTLGKLKGHIETLGKLKQDLEKVL